MDADKARRSATRVGLVTLPIGIGLVLTPSQVSRVLRIREDRAALRAIGAADLLLVPGLLAGNRRWPFLLARAGLNVVIGAYCLRLARRDGSARATAGAIAMVLATAADSRTIIALRRLGR